MGLPVFALDVDGVLADFTGRLCERVRERASWCPIQPTDIVHWKLSKCMSSEAFTIAREVMHEPGFAYSLDVYPDARALVETLRRYGHVVALTAPLASSPTWIGERTAWLVDKLGFRPRDIVFCPSAYKARFACDVLIEDSEGNRAAWADAQLGTGFLVSRPWVTDPDALTLPQIARDIAAMYPRLKVAA